jgi:tetratricopeptide (TPR) repeat protein
MKKLILLASLLFSFSTYLSAEPLKSISLTEECEGATCKPHTWWLTDSFSTDFLAGKTDSPIWKEVNEFPVWMNKYYSGEGSLKTYSMITTFDYPEALKLQKKVKGLSFGEIGEVFEIYVNGNLIASEGKVFEDRKVDFHRTVRGQAFEVPEEFLKDKENILVVKLQGHPKFDHTGFYLKFGYEFGIHENLQYAGRDFSTLVLIGIYLVFGFYHIFLYIKRPKEAVNLFMGLVTTFLSVYLYTRTSIIFENKTWDTEIIQRIELIFLYPMTAIILMFQDILFFNQISKKSTYYLYFTVGLAIPTLATPMYISEYLLRVWQLSALLFMAPNMFIILFKAIRDKIPAAKRVFFAFVLTLSSAIYDILDSAIFNSGLSFTKYTFFTFIMTFIVLLAEKFVELHNSTEELNANLEKKVEERTRELSESLKKVNELKVQQDGDYFLTSLLIKPLGRNFVKSDTIQIEFLTKQKKKFEFKNKHHEIGGDLSAAHNIELQGRKYVVYMNSDAMGKSIQGAGGALVLGSLFQSIIERTKLSVLISNQSPERWLKNTFVELHKIFESFDGSMLVSLVMGLIDEENGFMYHMNAEHPWIVLYRDEKTEFLNNDLDFRKLGSIGEEGQLFIRTFQLMPGDILFGGSDGRDDIVVTDPTGNKFINEDHELFLQHVIIGKGKMLETVNSVLSKGELYDDLSLIRIEYTGAKQPVPNYEYDKNLKFAIEQIEKKKLSEARKILNNLFEKEGVLPDGLKILAKLEFESKNYKEAALASEKYTQYIPGDTDMLYFTGESYFNAGENEIAISFGEKLRLRDPNDVRTLKLLFEVYHKTKNKKQTAGILNRISEIDPKSSDLSIYSNRLKELAEV